MLRFGRTSGVDGVGRERGWRSIRTHSSREMPAARQAARHWLKSPLQETCASAEGGATSPAVGRARTAASRMVEMRMVVVIRSLPALAGRAPDLM